MQDPSGSRPVTQQRTSSASDVDFADVFGGPPRRSSRADLRRSPESSLDSGSRPGSGLGEKPVFGGETSSPAGMRHLGDEFYNDIFSGGESSSPSPRREFFPPRPSAPGSRISSPTRSSLLSQFSLSMKSVKDQPIFGSPTHRTIYKSDEGSLPSSPTPRAVTAQDDLKLDGHGLYRQSPLSRPNSQSMERSSDVTDSPSVDVEIHLEKDQASLESYISSDQFHFSIYRWAGKEVALVMPSSSKNKYGGVLARLPDIVVEEVDMNIQSEDNSTPSTASKILSESQDNKLLKDLYIEDKQGANSTLIDDLLPAEFDSKFLPGDRSKVSAVGNEDIIRLVEEEVVSRGQKSVSYYTSIKQQAGKENKRKPVEVSSPTTSDSSICQEEKKVGSKVKGKVKDFIKKFNHETFPKRKGTFETSGKRPRGKDEGRVEDQVNNSAAKVEEHVETIRSNNSASSDIPVPMNQNQEKEGKANTYINSDVRMIDDLLERNDPSRHFSDSTPEILDASTWNVEESHCEDLEGCLIEERTEGQNQNLQTDSLQDQTKSIDAKIREWSKGKEGNIRSLLSTLQYILWPESGWKQVPLVDIIEDAPVKRAYQKALLCLHPDKLQQKGASAHQKYTAEKVFDILQEAWIHFNSSSQM